MPKEIERKFLVSGNGWRRSAGRGKAIRQAYLAHTNSISLRVRIIGRTKSVLTIKSAQYSMSRPEFEFPISLKDARALMKLRTGRIIAKQRYMVRHNQRRFEIDVYKGHHRGLVIAEIELPTRQVRFDRPQWLGKEVTGNKRFYNATLANA